MVADLDLTFWPYLDDTAHWESLPDTEQAPEVWLWRPAVHLAVECDLDTINRLVAAGWERLKGTSFGPDLDGLGYLHMRGQLTDMRIMTVPGRSQHEIWARSADIQRIADAPAALAFARPPGIEHAPGQAITHYPSGCIGLQVAQVIPPPQFGEYGLVLTARGDQIGWQIYPLSVLGNEGLEIWKQLGDVLTKLAEPAEWWPHTKPLEACLRGQYGQLREELRSKLLATSGQERETWRERLALLEIDNRHAKALRAAHERAQQDPAAWLERWQMVEDLTQQLAVMYWQAHIAASRPVQEDGPAIIDTASGADIVIAQEPAAARQPDDPEAVAMLSRIVESSVAPTLDTPSFLEDRAAREAILSDKKTWGKESGILRYIASNSYAVYFGHPEHPMDLTEAQEKLLRIRDSTVLTIRIAEGIWNQRRRDPHLTRDGMSLILYNEILQWRGVQKHKRPAYAGSQQMTTDGWRTEDREDVRLDFEVARLLYLRGKHTVYDDRGKPRDIHVDDVYIRAANISTPTLWGPDEHLGVFFAPGSWFTDYDSAGNVYLAEIDRRVFQLNPQNHLHELRLALYFAELWRYQASGAKYGDPITMEELLRKSVITVDRKHLVYRFIPRIESALANLKAKGIIGEYECLTPTDRNKGRWGSEWLKSRWRILPPAELMQSYVDKGITRQPLQLPGTRRGRPPKRAT